MLFQPGRNHRIEFDEEEKMSPKVKAVLTATLIASLGALYYVVGNNIRGVPSAPKNGVSLQDPNLDREIQCYREAFNDACQAQAFDNVWFDKNCKEFKAAVDAALASEHPLKTLTEMRDDVLTRSTHYKPGDEKWYKTYMGQGDGFGMRIETSKEARMKAKQIKQSHKRVHQAQTR